MGNRSYLLNRGGFRVVGSAGKTAGYLLAGKFFNFICSWLNVAMGTLNGSLLLIIATCCHISQAAFVHKRAKRNHLPCNRAFRIGILFLIRVTYNMKWATQRI